MSLLSSNTESQDIYYYQELNSAIEKTLSYEQKNEIKRVLQRAVKVPSKKIVTLEISFWFIKRFYIVFYLGFDKRNGEKRFSEGTLECIFRLSITFGIYFILWGSTIIVFLSILYYTKSVLGIDVYPDQHLSEIIKSGYQNVDRLYFYFAH